MEKLVQEKRELEEKGKEKEQEEMEEDVQGRTRVFLR
jgi:hypothetical protein